jgi:FAD/FMN-containing dehydrogenase
MVGGGCPTVAVAGYMMGGGYGMTSRAFGIQCDLVEAVTVMLADGNIVMADENNHADLFWAIRGGTGGNFGVLLNITYKLTPLGKIWGAKIAWPLEPDYSLGGQVLQTIQNTYLTSDNYNQLGIETILTTDTDGVKKVFFCTTWLDDEASFDQALAPMMAIPGAEVLYKNQGVYSVINAKVLEGTPDVPEDIMAFVRSAILERALTQEEWTQIVQQFCSTAPNQYTMVDLECYGGAINSKAISYNAFIHRNGLLNFYTDAFFNEETNDREQNRIWLEEFYAFLGTFCNGHSYQNYPNRSQTDFANAYWGGYYPWLQFIKAKYDPTNFFHYMQSVQPDTEAWKQAAQPLPQNFLLPISHENY